MLETKTSEIDYKGRKVSYQMPLGIYLDGKITERIHDAIIPKYQKIIPDKLILLDKDSIREVNENAKRQLEGIATQDISQVREALRNTIDLTAQLLVVAE